MSDAAERTLRVADLGRQPYGPVLELQERTVEARRRGDIPDTFFLVEHLPVFTLGRSAQERNVLVPEEELRRQGISVFRIGRGGDVTFHGPGQLVGYPILDLQGTGRRVLWYVSNLERVLIAALARLGVTAKTDPINRGVWVGTDKIAAIGVRVTRHVTMHGFALNVCTDLRYYELIVPCGIRGRGVTSLDRQVPDVSMADVKQCVVAEFCRVFGYARTESGAPGVDDLPALGAPR